MLRYESEDMDFEEDPEEMLRYGCFSTGQETWILPRILRYLWMSVYGSGQRDVYGCLYGSGVMDFALRYTWMLRHECEDMNRTHVSCKGS